jgi:hypothetical protein
MRPFHWRSLAIATLAGMATIAMAHAKESDVPKINLDQRCRDSQRVMEMLGTNTSTVDVFQGCKTGELQALKQLGDEWPNIPSNVRSRCIVPTQFSPSYIEWQACVEVDRDVRQIRRESKAAIAGPKNCPIIEFQPDGSVTSVVACALEKYGR